MKHIIFALSILASSVSIAQNVEKDLNTIETADQAEAYIKDKQKKISYGKENKKKNKLKY